MKKSGDLGLPLRTTSGLLPKSVNSRGTSANAVAILDPAIGRLSCRIFTVSPACSASANRRAVSSWTLYGVRWQAQRNSTVQDTAYPVRRFVIRET